MERTNIETPILYPLRSPEWYKIVLCKALGYEELKPWQLSLTMDLCDGKDVFLVIGTGEGKSCLVQAPVIADAKAGRKTIGIVLVPTKALADDQARAAKKKGIEAIAVHEDSVRAWQNQTPSQSLFTEVGKGRWSLIFMGPEMLTETSFNELIHQVGFLEHLRYFTIDECHLTTEWSFRSSYARIVHLRNRFPAGKIVWLALSATISSQNQPKFVNELGFSQDRRKCTILRLAVDRRTLTYIPRICQYSGNSLLDFSTLIPLSATKPSDIPITVIFAQRIDFGNRLMTYLTNILPKTITGADRKHLILPYNSMMSPEFRLAAVEALRLGTRTRILLCTDSGAFGIDIINIERAIAIVTDVDETYETLCQKLGRIRIQGLAITYFPRWADKTRKAKNDTKMRGRLAPVMVEYANATVRDCPRAINCRYWGERLQTPIGVPCCNRHHPEIDSENHKELESRKKEQKLVKARQPNLRSDGTHRPVGKTLRPVVHQFFRQWRATTWLTSSLRSPHCPPHRLISDELLLLLCKRMHVCTTMDRFRVVLAAWDCLDEFGEPLFDFCQKLLVSTDQLYSPPENRRKRKMEGEETLNH